MSGGGVPDEVCGRFRGELPIPARCGRVPQEPDGSIREIRIGVGGGKDAGDALRTLCPGGPSEDRRKPDTFDFLGFKHVCGTDRGGKFALVRVPCDKSRRKFLAKSKQWLSRHRHWKRRDQQKQLVMMLRGFYQYFGLHHCKPKLDGVRHEVQRQWAPTLRRTSQRHRLYWSYLLRQSWFELPYAVSTLHATV